MPPNDAFSTSMSSLMARVSAQGLHTRTLALGLENISANFAGGPKGIIF